MHLHVDRERTAEALWPFLRGEMDKKFSIEFAKAMKENAPEAAFLLMQVYLCDV